MWKTCLPRRLERRDETLEDEDCFFADLKPEGGLKACGSMKETLDLVQAVNVSRGRQISIPWSLSYSFLVGSSLFSSSSAEAFSSLSLSLSLSLLPLSLWLEASDPLPDSDSPLDDSSASRFILTGEDDLLDPLSSLSDSSDDDLGSCLTTAIVFIREARCEV